MIIYPTIELQGGRCVSLSRGRMEEPVIWHVDPVEKACEFAEAGASWMQVTDFDAIAGTGENSELIGRIIREAGIPVQVAGGIRARGRIEEWLDHGAGRVVIGTAGVVNPDMVLEAAKYHPDSVVLAVDVFRGHVMSQGWRETSTFTPEVFIEAFAEAPLAAFLITDIDADIGDTDAAVGLISGLAGQTRTPVIASGLVRELDDISRLIHVPNIDGAIIGRALFNRAVDLGEALKLAAEPCAPAPQFI